MIELRADSMSGSTQPGSGATVSIQTLASIMQRLPHCLIDASVDRKSTRLNSSHDQISYAVFCLKKKKTNTLTLQACHQSPLHSTTSHSHYYAYAATHRHDSPIKPRHPSYRSAVVSVPHHRLHA